MRKDASPEGASPEGASPKLRGRAWSALGLAAATNFAAYYNYDAIAPVADMLHTQRGLGQTQIGLLNAVYSLPSIPLALAGGVLVDRIGPARAALIAAALGLLGACLTAWGQPFGVMVAGRLLFGTGAETLYVALLVGISQWFGKAHAALAMALFFSVARVGSYLADISPRWAGAIYAAGWQAPLWLAAGIAGFGLVCAAGFWALERARRPSAVAAEAPVRLADLRGLGASFWQICWLNVLFASVFFPFRSTFSIAYFQAARGLSLAEAGLTNSWVFFAAIIATPLCGLLADRFGRRASLLALGASLMPLNFLLLATTHCSLWITTALMGVSFSVIPAVIWPATTMLVPRAKLGSAFGLINMLQSLGLTVSNMVAGALNDRFHAGAANPSGYWAMFAWFGGWASVAAFCAYGLVWRERRGGGAGLEGP